MKPLHTVLALTALAGLLALGAMSLRRTLQPAAETPPPTAARPLERVYSVRGMVLSVNPPSGIVKIAHEEIPDYMPAMTMPFMVRDSNLLRDLKVGDQISFTLSVTSDDSWISAIEKRENASSTGPVASASPGEGEEKRLRPGEKIPDLDFVDQAGTARQFKEFEGRYAVVTFIYTRCPLPNFCPLLTRKFSELQARLQKEFPGKFHLISVTIDPIYDTPEMLKRYASVHTIDSSTWTFATGTVEQVAALAELFGLTYSQGKPGLIDHDMRTALLSPSGRLIHIWKSNHWTPYEIRNRIQDDLSNSSLARN